MHIKAVPVMNVTPQGWLKMIRLSNMTFLLFLLIFLVTARLAAQDETIECRISYLSVENAYVNKGEDTGLAVGDTLVSRIENKIAAMLIIEHVSQHSASCKIVFQEMPLQVGSGLTLKKRKTYDSKKTVPAAAAVSEGKTAKPDSKNKAPFTRISGGISLQWYHFDDRSGNDLSFDQPTMRFNLKARQIWSKDFNLIIRMRLRQDQRSSSFSAEDLQQEWRNRIYTFYFSYDNKNSPINFSLGRIHSNKISGVGYLDGLLLQHNISSHLNWGIYGGIQSEWQFAGADPSLQKYGLFFNYLSGEYQTERFETTVALNAVYHDKTVSRENVYFQTSFITNGNFSIYNSFDVDINRSWRKDKTDNLLSLSSFYLAARYKFSNVISSGLTYDNRKNYYTYETRDLPEELYDMAYRHGLQADLYLDFNNNYHSNIRFGIKKREGDSETTYTGHLGLRKGDLIVKRLNLGLNLRGYSNAYSEGLIPTVSLAKYFIQGHYISFSGGQNRYQLKTTKDWRFYQWMRINGNLQLFGSTYLGVFYTYEWGDDSQGHKIIAEVGYRF